MFYVFFGLYNLFPLRDQRCPLYILYMYVATFHCPKGILCLGGESIKNTERRQFNFRTLSVLKKTLERFENLVFVIMSTRENVCLIAISP